ncbi:MAG: hypothetical protein AMJ53_15405 [Gammaproteobacteria bacterium SG8_11]|nr:MAG: hypothetical protein AMJ53_15405 [Gammaproteobacteria bacterium SG8_11]
MNYFHKTFNKNNGESPVQLGLKRNQLYHHFNNMGLKVGAEIGVATGKNALRMCEQIPDLKLFCIDPWEYYEKNPRVRHWQENYDQAVEKLKPYNAILVKGYSEEVVHNFEDGSLDFVYIDGNHMFDFVMQDIILWAPKVRKGGIISGHDYYNFRNAGVVDAVDAYIKAHKIEEWYLTSDKTPSWMWVK